MRSNEVGYDAELDAQLQMLAAGGLIELLDDDTGGQVMRLTPKGVEAARDLAASDGYGDDALLTALLSERWLVDGE